MESPQTDRESEENPKEEENVQEGEQRVQTLHRLFH